MDGFWMDVIYNIARKSVDFVIGVSKHLSSKKSQFSFYFLVGWVLQG